MIVALKSQSFERSQPLICRSFIECFWDSVKIIAYHLLTSSLRAQRMIFSPHCVIGLLTNVNIVGRLASHEFLKFKGTQNTEKLFDSVW